MVFCYRDGFLLLLDPTASRKEHSITIYFCQYSWEVWLQKWMQTFWPKSLSMHCLEAESRRQKVYMLQMRNTETSKLLLIFIEGLEAPQLSLPWPLWFDQWLLGTPLVLKYSLQLVQLHLTFHPQGIWQSFPDPTLPLLAELQFKLSLADAFRFKI